MRMTIHEYIWVSLGLFLVSMVLFGTPSLLTQESFGSRLASLGSLGLLGSFLDLLVSFWISLKPLILFFCVPFIDLLLLS